jgi:hypothetical protein
MLSIRDGTLQYLAGAFLAEDIDMTIHWLSHLNIEVTNSNGEFKPFNEVMEQIYKLHIHE